MAHLRIARLVSVLVLAISGALVAPTSVFAGTIGVTTFLDEDGGPGDPAASGCSLREALTSANTLTARGGCNAGTGVDTIDVPAGIYLLSPALPALPVGGTTTATISVVGAGAALTTVTRGPICNTAPIFEINESLPAAPVITATISGLTISGGLALGTNGGAIYGGIFPADSLTVNDSIFTANCAGATRNGGAIGWGPFGNLTVNRSTFVQNNTGVKGGAIYFETVTAGALTVTDSTFTSNFAAGIGGGAIAVSDLGPPNLVSLNGNKFTGNLALGPGGAGGAIYQSGGTLQLGITGANAFLGNVANNPATSGLAVTSVVPATATNNWWGCNGGPGAAGCDKAASLDLPTLVFDPWLVLSNAANPSAIAVDGTSTLTADFLHNSNATVLPPTQVAAMTGRAVTWNNAVNGSLSAQQTTIQSTGTATATFTATGLGAGSADAHVDNATATASLTIDKGNPTTMITSDNPDPSVVGQPITVQYSVTPATPIVPTGNVTVSDGVDSCTATVAAGQCTLTLTTLGNRSLMATYVGDANFNGSTSAPATHTVSPPPPTVDTTPPAVSNVTTILREGGHIGSVSVTVSWSATDDLTPTDSLVFQIQRRRLRALGWTAWQDVATVTGQTSLYQVPLWHRYQYRVRATDQAGHVGDYAEALPITFIRRDERHFTRDASWTITPVAGAMRGRVARSATPGGMASLTFTGNGIALVATTGPGQGTLQACIDPGTASQSCRTVDLGAMPAGLKQLPVVFSLPWTTHTLQVTVIAGTVDLDGAIFSR